ncbi:hypothetical protein COEREDRAFT_89128 [Coemansia reversa NRRL 1564]|uniref:Uncharacterized protein n=1 Tax=Coemansia reversa (strain ATCC 12441 / NRRL 1564) TaxID=763665 RepID=A0A2G5B4I8_COERN|nr:hypothetical protein COEREDRAFT_89128 [Coemansia reversa NRRL 1564]|eukprot:PIA13912.1 hypothetical protein COEREDRAFT_89128 [Coemansia reversa NRRL 1564]
MQNSTLKDKNINSQHSSLSESDNHTEAQINDKAPATKTTNATTNHVLEMTMKHGINHALENNSQYKSEKSTNSRVMSSYDNDEDFMYPPSRKYGSRFPEQAPQQIPKQYSNNQQGFDYHSRNNYYQWYSWD